MEADDGNTIFRAVYVSTNFMGLTKTLKQLWIE